jgi:putative sporulation protein YtaF
MAKNDCICRWRGKTMGIVALLTVLGFALSSSIDNFGVGVSYGVSNIKIGFVSNLIIAIIAFGFSVAGIMSGKYISKIMPGTISTVIAALFVFIIGVRIILITLTAKRKSGKLAAGKKRRTLGTYIEKPMEADLDKSGEISTLEALVLGAAVSMNALTNGLGAGLLGLSPIAISAAAAIFSFLAIWLGVRLGLRVANVRIGSMTLGQFSTLISGGILLLIAVHMIL